MGWIASRYSALPIAYPGQLDAAAATIVSTNVVPLRLLLSLCRVGSMPGVQDVSHLSTCEQI